MPILKKKKPLRGSIRQQRLVAAPMPPRRLSFGVRLALLILGTITVIMLVSWVWRSRWPHALVHNTFVSMVEASRIMGFAVTDVTVEGRHYTDRKALFDALGVRAGSPIFLFDPQKAHENIIALPWVAEASILRSLPSKIIITLTERQPIARWQNGDKTLVIDRDGQEIPTARSDLFGTLPLVVGNAAPEQTRNLLTVLQKYPVAARALKAAARVGERRWNLYLYPNVLVRLPEEGIEKALTKLTFLIQEKQILDHSVKTIDLRLPDRMAIEPAQTENAATPKEETTP